MLGNFWKIVLTTGTGNEGRGMKGWSVVILVSRCTFVEISTIKEQ
jgi:hypothetical protein